MELCTLIGAVRKEQGMTDRTKLFFRKGDWIAVLLVVALALGVGIVFRPRESDREASVVQIYQEGKLLRELPLSTEETLVITGKYKNTVEIRDNAVSITHSTCPGEDCVHSGEIRKAGRSLVCLPNGLEVRITGSGDIDFVVG